MLGGWVHNFISILSEKVWDCSKDYCFVVIVSYYSGIIINAPIILWRQKWKPLYILLSKAATIFSNIQQALLSRAVCFFFKVSVLIHSFLLLEVLNLSKSIFSISLFSDFPFLLFDYKGLLRSDRHPLFMYFCHLLLLFIMYFFQPLTPFCHFDKLFHLILLLILVMHPFFSCIMIVCNNYNDQILYFNLFPFFSHICIVDKHFMVSYVYIYKKKRKYNHAPWPDFNWYYNYYMS